MISRRKGFQMELVIVLSMLPNGRNNRYNADSKGELARSRRPVEIILELQNWNNNAYCSRVKKKKENSTSKN